MSSLSRRQFMLGTGGVGLGLLTACGRLPWQAAPVLKVPRIGFLSAVTSAAIPDLLEAFRQGLADHSYVEGQNLAIEWRFADGTCSRVPALAAELVSLAVDLIVVAGSVDARAARAATSTIPIVVAGSGTTDLVEDGLAASLSHPGGNVTGLNNPTITLDGKRLQLLLEAVPGASRLAVLSDANSGSLRRDLYEAYAKALGVQLHVMGMREPSELPGLFGAAAEDRVEALSVRSSPLTVTHRTSIVALAAEHRLPAMYGAREFVSDGGLMSYTVRTTDLYRRAATYVERILKGTQPADLPIEQPMLFDFVVNPKTAQALGITFPNEIMLQVTDVIY